MIKRGHQKHFEEVQGYHLFCFECHPPFVSMCHPSFVSMIHFGGFVAQIRINHIINRGCFFFSSTRGFFFIDKEG